MGNSLPSGSTSVCIPNGTLRSIIINQAPYKNGYATLCPRDETNPHSPYNFCADQKKICIRTQNSLEYYRIQNQENCSSTDSTCTMKDTSGWKTYDIPNQKYYKGGTQIVCADNPDSNSICFDKACSPDSYCFFDLYENIHLTKTFDSCNNLVDTKIVSDSVSIYNNGCAEPVKCDSQTTCKTTGYYCTKSGVCKPTLELNNKCDSTLSGQCRVSYKCETDKCVITNNSMGKAAFRL